MKNKRNLQGKKVLHPNSRKTRSISKTIKRISSREKSKHAHQMKQNIIGEKLIWFKDNLPSCDKLSHSCVTEIIEKYLHRFDSELEQIALKHSIGGQRQRQHASREDIIKLTMKREREEYTTCGIEIPNILDDKDMKKLREWNGELRFLQNFKLVRVTEKHLVNEIAQKNPEPAVVEMACSST